MSGAARPVLFTLHGGCFVGGSAAWDGPQTAMLRDLGFVVHQLEFDKSSLDAALEDIRRQVREVAGAAVLGRSSGGYMAKVLFEEGLFDKAIYICPVLDPATRGRMLPALGARAAPFFKGTTPPALRGWDPRRELLLLAKDDENVPSECFSKEQLDAAVYFGPRSHKGATTSTSSELARLVRAHLG